MESHECNGEKVGEQTQCRPSKSLLYSSSFNCLPPDQDLKSLFSQTPSSPPFIISDDFFVLKQNEFQQHPSYKLHEKILNYNRKQKSLQELSKKFLYLFEGKNLKYLELDKVTEDLGVQRRRIYDVINILESLNVVSKKAKNHYRWKGLEEAVKTIELFRKNPDTSELLNSKKEKSLEFLANNFLKLILKKNVISLDEAAKEIIKDVSQEILKTKVRRLYDIVNVFKSLRLVKKITLNTKKPGFKWLGVENLKEFIKEKKQNKNEDRMQVPDLQTPTKAQKSKQIPQISKSFFVDFIGSNINFDTLGSLRQVFQNNLFQDDEKQGQRERIQKENFQPNILENYQIKKGENSLSIIRSGFNLY